MRTKLVVIALVLSSSVAGCGRKEEPAASPPEEPGPSMAASVGATGAKEGEMCGGVSGQQCDDAGQYCAMDPGKCSNPDASGTCKVKPTACTEQHDPVCGCDGNTYDNACKAEMAGVNVNTTGECQVAGSS
jgi:hypothetical protein